MKRLWGGAVRCEANQADKLVNVTTEFLAPAQDSEDDGARILRSVLGKLEYVSFVVPNQNRAFLNGGQGALKLFVFLRCICLRAAIHIGLLPHLAPEKRSAECGIGHGLR